MYEVVIRLPAQHFVKSLNKEEQKELLDSISQLENNPRLGKELIGKLSGLRSLRVDTKKESYRVIYKIEDLQLVVLVMQAGYRSDIYNKKIGK